MDQANAIRGRFFYLAQVFIAAPFLVNLLVLPQLSEATAPILGPAISVTSSLSITGIVFLLLYIRKILSF